ncbi:MAG TPA: cobalt-precorrin-6A reductase [Polyangiales bacterium]|nr:cobalt-precorrin-6A reductase [Polyangiales bacterium]
MAETRFKLLILGGTTQGRVLAERLTDNARFDALLSFAGRTSSLQAPALPHRVGGFGGIAGLVEFLRVGRFDALIDATHPFAARMSVHAVRAAEALQLPLLRVEQPAWTQRPGDQWQEVDDTHAAAHALGPAPRRVFLTIGRLEIDAFRSAPQHHYLARAVDQFELPLPHARLISARGPFDESAERALLEREKIEVLVSKNAGTDSTYAKIAAARALGLPVIMVRRPQPPAAETASSVDAAEAWLARVHELSQRRGE